MDYDKLVQTLKGLNLSELSIKEMEYLMDLFKVKSGVIEKEIRSRKLRDEI